MSKKIIVATDEKGLIGKGNTMPWHLPADFKYFKDTTVGSPIIMGSNTFYSLGKALPNRKNIVISSRKLDIERVEIYTTIEEALELYPDCFIIGGAKIYKYTLDNNLVDEIYLTKIHHTFEDGDAYFKYDESKWNITNERLQQQDEKNKYDHSYLILKKAP